MQQAPNAPARPRHAGGVPRPLVATILLGTLLNPLNSSMIAVALLPLRDEFDVSLATASWLVSGFFLASAVGQPLTGRLADLLGPRRVFCAGWVVVGLTGALAPLAPSFGWLLAARVVMTFGTSCAFPAGLAMIRRSTPDPGAPPPASALGALVITASVTAAFGPALGGALVDGIGWEGIFFINVPLTLIGLPLALRVLPRDAPLAGGMAAALRGVDWPGAALFVATVAGTFGFLLSLADGALWPLVAVVAVTTAALVRRERRAATPIVDLDVAGDRRIATVFAHYAAVNVVYYAAFFAVPVWLQEVGRYAPGEAGLLLLPVAGLGIVATPLAARLITRAGTGPVLLIGSLALTAGAMLMLTLGGDSSVAGIVLVSAALGLHYGFNTLALQAALYERAAAGSTGAAGGLMQTSRYLGSILATALIGALFGERATTGGLHEIALVCAAIGIVLVGMSAKARHGPRVEPAVAVDHDPGQRP